MTLQSELIYQIPEASILLIVQGRELQDFPLHPFGLFIVPAEER